MMCVALTSIELDYAHLLGGAIHIHHSIEWCLFKGQFLSEGALVLPIDDVVHLSQVTLKQCMSSLIGKG